VFETKPEMTGVGKVGGKKGKLRAIEVVGGERVLRAGPLGLEWGTAGAGNAIVWYEPENMRVQIARARDFQHLDLRRFMK
jgi:hypothetical protein